ncbi:hypothetical protein FM103_05850 [Corynebacterium xerosis]|nr:hypothetical protein FM103_05850 [Corynebacterium xerosis]
MDAAQAEHPETSVPTFQDENAQLTLAIVSSTASSVTLEVSIVGDPGSAVLEHDAIAFDVLRSTLISAAHDTEEWIS